jgi:GNAT superfamily N-acetyltransferase
MTARKSATPRLRVVAVTPGRWNDFEELFGVHGACAGCWCMYPRLPRSVYVTRQARDNKAAMRQRIARGGLPPGVLGYVGNEVVAWCAIEPREAFVRLERSRVAKPVDDQPAWFIPCLFVRREWRRKGLTVPLLEGAVEHARAHGAGLVEACPVDPDADDVPPAFIWHGIASAYVKAGFVEVARRSPGRPFVRRVLAPTDAAGRRLPADPGPRRRRS